MNPIKPFRVPNKVSMMLLCEKDVVKHRHSQRIGAIHKLVFQERILLVITDTGPVSWLKDEVEYVCSPEKY